MKAPHIMRRRVSYMSNEETGEEALHESLLQKNKLLAKCFEKINEHYVDVSKVQLIFLRVQ